MKRLFAGCLAVVVFVTFSFAALAQEAAKPVPPAAPEKMMMTKEMVKVEAVGKVLKTAAGQFVLRTEIGNGDPPYGGER